MKNFSIFKTFDMFFRIVVIFLICFVWCRYFIDSLWLSLILTVILTLSIDFFIKFLFNRKTRKNKAILDEQEKIQNYINSFIFSDDSFSVNFFCDLAKKKYNVIKKTKFIQIEHTCNHVILYPYFMYREFNADDLITVFNKVKSLHPKKIVICTNKIDSLATKLSAKLPIKTILLDYIDTYNQLLVKYDCFPPMTKLNEQQKPNMKYLLGYALNKKRTKGYFIASLFLLFSSFIVPYKIYYVIMSSILLTLSFISYINPKFNKKENVELLE